MKNKFILSSSALLLSLLACAPSEKHTLVFLGPDSDREDFLSAVQEWKNCPNAPEIQVSNQEERDTENTLIEPIQADFFYNPAGIACDGYTFPHIASVQYARGTTEGSRAVILHELGHVFGLSHHNQAGVMNPLWVHRMNTNSHLTEADCSALSQ